VVSFWKGEIAHFNLSCGTKFLAFGPGSPQRPSSELLPTSEGQGLPGPHSTAKHIAPAVKYEAAPCHCADRQFSGTPSVFGFVLSGPGLDGTGYAVMKYRWL